MYLISRRGNIEDLTTQDNNHTIDCRIGACKIKIHPDLVSSVGSGDDVLVAGESRSEVLHALAVHNITREKLAHIDSTNYFLVIALTGYISVMCAAFGLQAIGTPTLVEYLEDAVSIIGLAIVVVFINKIVRVNWATKRVSYPDVQ